jgi:predicted nuclease with TOPRIM domain
MNKKLNRLRSTRDKKRTQAEKLAKDMDELDTEITQLEDLEIVKAVREYRMTPEELTEFLRDLHGEPVPGKSLADTTMQEDESDEHEALV